MQSTSHLVEQWADSCRGPAETCADAAGSHTDGPQKRWCKAESLSRIVIAPSKKYLEQVSCWLLRQNNPALKVSRCSSCKMRQKHPPFSPLTKRTDFETDPNQRQTKSASSGLRAPAGRARGGVLAGAEPPEAGPLAPEAQLSATSWWFVPESFHVEKGQVFLSISIYCLKLEWVETK